jgi:tRNA-dihydrouridine synthase B
LRIPWLLATSPTMQIPSRERAAPGRPQKKPSPLPSVPVPDNLAHVEDARLLSGLDLDGESAWWRDLSLESFRIGDVEVPNRFLLAPMCNITNLPFRVLARREGASLGCTEMLSGVALARGGEKTLRMLEILPGERPVMVQISGTDPEALLRAAELAQGAGASIMNLNCGCPAKKVTSGCSGAALLKDPRLIARILKTLRPALHIPLTVKLRSGWNETSINAIEVARICEDEGCDALMLHPRTRSQLYRGRANWDLITSMKQAVSIPVVGNGDICSAEDAFTMMDTTGCDAVMIGRASIGNPWIFRQCVLAEAERSGSGDSARPPLPPPLPSPSERKTTILRHFELYGAYAGEARASRQIRGQLMAYVKGLPGAVAFRARVSEINGREILEELLDGLFPDDGEETP